MTPLIAQQRSEIEALCRCYRVRRLELFGSAATGRDRPDESDLDFLVEFEPLAAGGYADAYFGLRESLEKLSARSVDLVVYSAIKNPYFRQSVERTKMLLYAA
ncbi:MAG TPA: nucleotidyltransferase domain-containing protein [Candidatus Acidoferrales bacterium]